MSDTLIIFAKNPELGKTKTRIGKKLGDEVALAIYYKLIHQTQVVTQDLKVNKVVYYSDFIDKEDSWDNNVYSKKRQLNSDLGERMYQACKNEIDEGASKVVLIGTDIYSLTTEIIIKAFDQLDEHDIVLGPAKDGGYYLIGMRESNSKVFELSEWSHAQVFQQTKEIIESLQLKFSTVDLLNDIDEPEDLIGTDLENLIV